MSQKFCFQMSPSKVRVNLFASKDCSLSCVRAVFPYRLRITEKAMGTLLANVTIHRTLHTFCTKHRGEGSNLKRQETTNNVTA